MSNTKFQPKYAFLISAGIILLFAGIEVYGLMVVGDWSLLKATVPFQVIAITLAVAPMMYGLMFMSESEEDD